MEWETRAKQKNAELVKLNTTAHEGFYVVYYYTYYYIADPCLPDTKPHLQCHSCNYR